jgi:hypothetical protein
VSLASLVGGVLIAAPAAQAGAPVDIGHRDHSYRGTTAPTAEKPQSKLWFHDGAWWGVLFRPAARGGRFTIHRLDSETQTWVNTSVTVETREGVHVDALSHGDKLYVAASRGSANPSLDRAVRVRSYTYDRGSRSYSADKGYPVELADGDVEAVVIDRDATGVLWATFVLDGRVMVTHTRGAANRWVRPYVLPVGDAAHVRSEPAGDQSAVVAFGGTQVGIMFSNQVDRSGDGVMYWATHAAGADDRAWTLTRAFAGPRLADEHINLKALPNGDRAGLVLAAVKTSLHAGSGERSKSQKAVHLLRLRGDGAWTSHAFGTVTDNHTRPLLQIDTDNRKIYVLAASPCCRGGTVYMKASSLDHIAFPSGKGTPFITSGTDANLNNPTGTKQAIGRESGLLVLASDDVAGTYVHNRRVFGGLQPRVSAAAVAAAAAPARGATADVAPPAPPRPAGTSQGSAGGAVAGANDPPTGPTQANPAPDLTVQPAPGTRQVYFGWFSTSVAFTGAYVLAMTGASVAMLAVGTALAVAGRRRRRAARAVAPT